MWRQDVPDLTGNRPTLRRCRLGRGATRRKVVMPPVSGTTNLTERDALPRVRRIGMGDLGESLVAGFADFLAVPTQLLFLGTIYPLVGLIAARAAWGGP